MFFEIQICSFKNCLKLQPETKNVVILSTFYKIDIIGSILLKSVIEILLQQKMFGNIGTQTIPHIEPTKTSHTGGRAKQGEAGSQHQSTATISRRSGTSKVGPDIGYPGYLRAWSPQIGVWDS